MQNDANDSEIRRLSNRSLVAVEPVLQKQEPQVDDSRPETEVGRRRMTSEQRRAAVVDVERSLTG